MGTMIGIASFKGSSPGPQGAAWVGAVSGRKPRQAAGMSTAQHQKERFLPRKQLSVLGDLPRTRCGWPSLDWKGGRVGGALPPAPDFPLQNLKWKNRNRAKPFPTSQCCWHHHSEPQSLHLRNGNTQGALCHQKPTTLCIKCTLCKASGTKWDQVGIALAHHKLGEQGPVSYPL